MSTNDKPRDDRPRYTPSEIEPKWQALWDAEGTFCAERHAGRPKKYILDMFPYPSGSGLHVGHPEGYTATDIVARYSRMRGFDVLHPMGWDAFGLPAEQYAIQTGTHPRETTLRNIATFKRQLKMLGFSFDWAREVDTTDPSYVKWTQWIFLQLFKKGLAFQAKVPVNWCAALGTVLANEEVIDGKSERGGHPVERLPLRQWMLRITEYADRLDADLAGLDWPETKAKQHEWIGRSEGAEVEFVVGGGAGAGAGATGIKVFTTRVDTLSGATYVVIAPEHPLAETLATAAQREAVVAYIVATRSKSDLDRADLSRVKTGVDTGARAVNPINGEVIPIWVADYVIGTYGTGAVMAVPAHDERDHAFAKTYGLPIVPVVGPASGEPVDVQKASFAADGVARGVTGYLAVADGTPSAEVRRLTTAWLAERNLGKARVTYKLRDWVFSRQRYWGEPIPIYFPVYADAEKKPLPFDPRLSDGEMYTDTDDPRAVDEADLPLLLPELEDFQPKGDTMGPLARARAWRFFQKGGQWFARETNTMPQWAGSCWYYLRYLDPKNDHALFDPAAYDAWMPVDLYVGGNEHAVLHLLYARFWHKVLFDLGVVKHSEPFIKLVHQGVILGENGEKMAKSRGNVVNPDDVVKSHGADTLRVYEMFMGPLESTKPWQTSHIEGAFRFLERVWNVCTGPLTDGSGDLATQRVVAKTVKKVGEDIEGMRFNTAISAMMILVKHLGTLPAVPREAARTFAVLISPFAPHLGEELWERLGGRPGKSSVAHEAWPSFAPALVRDDVVEIGVQVNGKVRGAIELAVDATKEAALAAAHANANVAAHLAGKSVKKVVYVAGKILNVIVG
jgi:leucyl-tRNA synthetase